MMKDFLKKLTEIDTYYANMPKKEEKKAFKMPFGKTIIFPFSLFMNNLKNIVIAIGIYSAVLTILSLVMGYTFLCSYPGIEVTTLYCAEFNALYIVYLLIKIFIMVCFMLTAYNIMLNNNFNIKDVLKFGYINIKAYIAFILFILMNMIPVLSLNILVMRVPNPNWKIEALFFAFVSLGFLAPFVLMRLYAAWGYLFETGKLTSIKQLWIKTQGNTFKIVIGVSLIMIFSILLMANYYANFKDAFDLKSVWYSATTSELLYNIILLSIMALVVGHFKTQREVLISDAANDN